MIFTERNFGKDTKTASLKLGGGWSGRVILDNAFGRSLSKASWADCLSRPSLLFEDVEKILKTEGRSCVAVKNLAIGDERLKAVIKRHWPEFGFRQFFRSFRPGKALREFKTVVRLLHCGIGVAAPLAAIQQRRKLLTRQSIYITEYLENSSELYGFVRDRLPEAATERFALKRQLSNQLAGILAGLHKNGMWHRDSKASNFVVCKGAKGQYRILLVDMDGIKRYFLRRKRRQFQSLWRLGASLMTIDAVNRTDYLRTFTTYCNLTGLELSQRRRIFRELASLAETKHLRSMLKAAANK